MPHTADDLQHTPTPEGSAHSRPAVGRTTLGVCALSAHAALALRPCARGAAVRVSSVCKGRRRARRRPRTAHCAARRPHAAYFSSPAEYALHAACNVLLRCSAVTCNALATHALGSDHLRRGRVRAAQVRVGRAPRPARACDGGAQLQRKAKASARVGSARRRSLGRRRCSMLLASMLHAARTHAAAVDGALANAGRVHTSTATVAALPEMEETSVRTSHCAGGATLLLPKACAASGRCGT